jgi:cytidylate kinase
MKRRSIAIDGPSGAGKSTLARKIAAKFGFIYEDTGAIYRCVGLYVLSRGVSAKDADTVTALLGEINIELRHDESGLQRMFLNGRDVTDDIRKPEVSVAASDVSAIPEVRRFLLEMQRDLAKKHDVIMDGRDIGTVVLPGADVKIFLTATSEARAARRWKELEERGNPIGYANVLSDLVQRDQNDSSRAAAPLRAAEDAILVDTTGYTLQESFEVLLKLIRERLGQ